MKLRPSHAEKALTFYEAVAKVVALRLEDKNAEEKEETCSLGVFIPDLANCIFTGHTNTDMDSIASAIAAAHLYPGGIAARSSDINSETEFCLKRWDIPMPIPFIEALDAQRKQNAIINMENSPEHTSRVCLVDHNQITQSPAQLEESFVVGIIDHHAMQKKTICTDKPVFVDIRPWGSACPTTILHPFILTYFSLNTHLTYITNNKIAGMLLSGILSDTLNLQSPTTTNHDRLAVATLASIAGVDDINTLAIEQFRAKSTSLASLSAYQIVCGDRKIFDCGGEIMAFGTCEFYGGMNSLLGRISEFMYFLFFFKFDFFFEEKLRYNFLTLVDIENMHSILVMPTMAEVLLARCAFKTTNKDNKNIEPLHYRNRVSRKHDFIPPLAAAINDGFVLPDDVKKSISDEEETAEYGPVVLACGEHVCGLQRISMKGLGLGVLACIRLSECVGHCH
eukprot:GSMAST32.ASY1.ANO1.2588.1 assembled CDS